MGDESFYFFIVLLYTFSNHSEEPECCNFLHDILSSEVAPCLHLSLDTQTFHTKYQRRPQVERTTTKTLSIV